MPSRRAPSPSGRRRAPPPPPSTPPPAPLYTKQPIAQYPPHQPGPSSYHPHPLPQPTYNAHASSSSSITQHYHPPVTPSHADGRIYHPTPAGSMPPPPQRGRRRSRPGCTRATAPLHPPHPIYTPPDPALQVHNPASSSRHGSASSRHIRSSPSLSVHHPLPPTPLTYTPLAHALLPTPHHPPSTSTRRHSFPRHLQQSPLPTLAPQFPFTLPSSPSPTGPTVPGIPPLPADHSTARLGGYQPDYIRATPTTTRRPLLSLDRRDLAGEQDGGAVRVPPPPTEAFLTLRLRREPRGGWPPVQRDEGADWTTGLEIVQEPEMGMGMGRAPLSADTPHLEPPLVVRVHFYHNGQPVPDDHPTVEKRLAYMTLHLLLLSADTEERIERVRLISDYDSEASGSGSGSGSSGSPGKSSTSSQESIPLLALVGSTFGIAKAATLGDGAGWYFVFPDLRVRPTGVFKLKAKLIDILGPGPSGTSTGIMPVSSTAITSPITVFGEDDYPGAEPPTGITILLAEQGLMGRRGRGEGSSSDDSSN